MADRKISELTALTGANTQDTDVLVIVDTSANETKKITLGELENALAERDFSFGDNDKLVFGAGSDLQIYHNSSNGNSYIEESGTGDLRILANNIWLADYSGQKQLTTTANAETKLYYNGSLKLATTSTGVDVTGTVTADGLTVDKTDTATYSSTAVDDTLVITRKNSSGTNNQVVGIEFDVTQASGVTTGVAGISAVQPTNASSADLVFQTRNAGTIGERMRIDSGGDISFYEDTGTTAKFFWDASAESLKLGHATTSFGDNELDLVGDGNGVRSGMVWMRSGVGDSVHQINANGSTLEFGSGGALDTTPSISIKSTGNVGIGSTNPNYKLVVSDGGAAGIEFGPEYAGDTNLVQHYDRTANAYMDVNNIAQNHRFGRGASEWMRITNLGKVGIGESNPDTLLHIKENQSGANSSVKLENSAGANNSSFSIDWQLASSGASAQIKADRTNDPSAGDTDLVFSTSTNGTSLAEAMRIAFDGDVGIGTTSPATKLDVAGTTTTDGLNLDAISETISDTAVDIFVYDTRKDSDGGAWRKRTQHTSWYNETLNTATRGSRKEFPAVAVIVAETNQVTIYDGDDPDLPMWMVFNEGAYCYLRGDSFSSVAMLNGNLFACNGGSLGSSWVSFIDDRSVGSIIQSNNLYYIAAPISDRNVNDSTKRLSVSGSDNPYPLVNNYQNDVAMTVLPNAPIDAATGLPVPTIAVATDGGVSVIKDDGTVVDVTGYSYDVAWVSIDDDGNMFSNGVWAQEAVVFPMPTSDATLTSLGYERITGTTTPAFVNTSSWTRHGVYSDKEIMNFGRDDGLYVSDEKLDTWGTGLQNHITSDYNTGWMNGDIKLATLSDTDDTNVTGSELVTNGTFDSDVSGWSAGASSTITYSSGVARLQLLGGGAAKYPKARTSLGTLTSGKKYTVSIGSYTKVSGNALRVKVNTNGDVSSDGQPGGTLYYNSYTDITNFSFTFEAGSTSEHFLWMYMQDSSDSTSEATYDNISVRLAEEDRSVNGNGLQVFGTVTKSAVASGADLVGYSGFSSSNYLQVPQGVIDLNETSFSMTCWFKTTSYSEWLMGTGDAGTFREARAIYVLGDGSLSAAGWFVDVNSGIDVNDGVWRQATVTWEYDTGTTYKVSIYVNGELKASGTDTYNTFTDTSIYIGYNPNSSNAVYAAGGSSVALARISLTLPSPDQIRKIYEDEKVLFQEGAQATLYGYSDAVTALAYDDSTELLHVGTSDGRSVFQGLRRVDNTTTAVGAAISASNGLVADE